jgi:hypothetical protein
MIPTTIQVSGLNMEEFSRPSAKGSGNYSHPPGGVPFPDPYEPVCKQLHALLTRKRGYYGCPDEGPLDNAIGVREQGIEPWVYQLARIGEKVRRCGGLARTLDSKEAVRKTLMDIAGHAVVAIALLDQRESENEH